MRKAKNRMLVINLIWSTAILTINYFYQVNNFSFLLKCVCSSGFALLGLCNLVYAWRTKQSHARFYLWMALGLLLAFLGDVLIGFDFIIGAATFALGHVCFLVAYCCLQSPKRLDYLISSVLFLGATAFLLFCPLLRFEVPIFQVVCIVYALIISAMLGKAIGNFVHKKSPLTTCQAVASALFFFSDLMLVFDWFIGLWSWTDHACMGTYYPSLCLLALSMLIQAREREAISNG